MFSKQSFQLKDCRLPIDDCDQDLTRKSAIGNPQSTLYQPRCQAKRTNALLLLLSGTPSRIKTREPRSSSTTLPGEVCHSWCTTSSFVGLASILVASGYRFAVRLA